MILLNVYSDLFYIQIALDISINNIFNTYAFKKYMWFSLHHFPTHSFLCICPAIVISSDMDEKQIMYRLKSLKNTFFVCECLRQKA